MRLVPPQFLHLTSTNPFLNSSSSSSKILKLGFCSWFESSSAVMIPSVSLTNMV
ncbi:MAG: hypothetical protein II507_13810 [Treponema sp.]|nr:hypothetical protein [Treponema sp.]